MGRTKKILNDKSLNESNSTTHKQNQSKSLESNIIDISDFKKKEKMYFNVVNEFFIKCSDDEIKKIIDIISGKYKISLRFLDWFVTRFCYLYKTSIKIDNNFNKEQDFNINISYKAQLKSFKKKYFDPFKRKNKFYYSFDRNNDDFLILTTLGQLNFFKWASSHDIIKYVENNFDKINGKINYVNSFFKKNIIDNSTSIISSEDINISFIDNNTLCTSDKTSYIDKKTLSSELISSNNSDLSVENKSITINLNQNLDNTNYIQNLNKYENEKTNSYTKLNKKKNISKSYNYPIISRKIFVEL